MSPLLPIRKYVSIDQLIVYCEVYEQTVQQRRRLADAAAALQQSDQRREQSAVKKVIDALNSKFQNVYKMPLLEETGSHWSATSLGEEFYKFARQIRAEYDSLERSVERYAPDEEIIRFAVRQTLSHLSFQIRAEGKREKITKQTDVEALVDEHYVFPLANDKVHFVVDELFHTDKLDLNKERYRYFLLQDVPVNLVVSPTHRIIDPLIHSPIHVPTYAEESEEAAATSFILIEDLKKIEVSMPRRALYARIAASISGTRLNTDDYLSISNVAALRDIYPTLNVVDSLIDDLALHVGDREEYAILLNPKDADRLDEITSVPHRRLELSRSADSKTHLYYSTAVITTQERAHLSRDTAIGQWVRVFAGMSSQIRSHKAAKVNVQLHDYEKPSFRCPHCSHRISYSPDQIVDATITRACANCLRVISFDRDAETATVISEPHEIFYTDEIYNEVFHCPTEYCNALFKPFVLKTTKGRDFVFCDTCNHIFQSRAGKMEVVKRGCPANECKAVHYFRVSEAHPVDEISCYNSERKIIFDASTGELRIGDRLQIKVAEVEQINEGDKKILVECPHFGCGDVRERRIFRNSKAEVFTRCQNCKNDIRIIPKSK